ncbi:unnamed protein product [Paramecium octaurelia]|uniref:Tubulin-tyrosine ligase family protein n=1 Tax=Paramecium octaurelia TaxID=43137 RepID=A0A8S1VGZ7_PAROT|nr:unnamed protein product [Paramecium octaurelia]
MKQQQLKEPHFNGEFEDSDSETEDNNSKKKTTLIMNVSDTQYDVVKFVGKKLFKWILQYEPDATNWDMFWTDAAVQPETLGKMQPYQKINHFPGMYSLARKNHLGRNLMKMRKQFTLEYKFFPQTWLLPAEYGDFKSQFVKGKARTFIIKPEASCQGRGIFLTRNLNDVNPNDHYVAQRYLLRPFLIEGLKFDLRVYVLLAGTDPMRIYVYQDGLVRFATEPYVPPNTSNLDDMCMHLTNYAINKENPNFVFNKDASRMDIGHKRSIKAVFGKLEEEGHDIKKLWQDMYEIFIKTFCAVQPILSHHYRSCQPDNYANNMCFEILGFDIFLNHKLQPILLEVNHTPSFTTDTPLDSMIKKNLIRDTLKLMNVNLKAKEQIIASRKESLQQRVLTGKKVKLTMEEKVTQMKQQEQQRNGYENAHLGDYVKIYPLEDSQKYDKYIEFASSLQDSWTGTNIKRNQKKNMKESQTPQQQQQIKINVVRAPFKPNTPVKNLPKLQNILRPESIIVHGEDEQVSAKVNKLSNIKMQPRQQSEPPVLRGKQTVKKQIQLVIPKPCLQPKLFDMEQIGQDKYNNKRQQQYQEMMFAK